MGKNVRNGRVGENYSNLCNREGWDNNGSNIEKGFGFHIERIEMKKGS